ncbi:hypothetical protein CAEBREN_15825 [Caenorhabditis brenneri]|uniref:Uncharacterized protein n=1 Tax=Caenorhabditis brenneri TaxID=135651 RepID=G0MUT9_CAEBE|nr:hypothetical protein CAEBREN_15825 [Caenorhabditis brenneri]
MLSFNLYSQKKTTSSMSNSTP